MRPAIKTRPARAAALLAALAPALALTPIAAMGAAAPEEPLAVKVLIINMFALEAAPWQSILQHAREISVPGLSIDYPSVRCDLTGVCQFTTGMGHANAAASMMAVLYSGLFDLHRTYFIVAGIGGIDPLRGTIGSVAWARYVVDTGIAQEIDARELPRGWHDGYFGIFTDSPEQKPKFDYHSEVYQLDESLLQRALALSHAVPLEDSADVQAYRAHYPTAPANAPPQVLQCDTASADTWWSGDRLGEHVRHWTRLLTDDAGVYCTTQQEDNATLTALTRAAQSGLIDLHRVAVLRSGSDFDRPYPKQDAFHALHDQRALDGAIKISTDNLVRAGLPLVEDIAQHWPQWQDGVPVESPP